MSFALAKNRQIVLLKGIGFNPSGELLMRIVQSIFVSLIAVLAAVAPPAFANSSSPNSHANTNAQAVEETPVSSGCHAYQKGPDGSWVELACHEGGGSDAVAMPAQSKSASHHQADQSTR
jgi:hypothetical protein